MLVAEHSITASLMLCLAKHTGRHTAVFIMQDVCLSVQVPAPVEVLQQPALLPELTPSSKTEPVAVQLVLQVPSSSSGTSGIPAANTAQVGQLWPSPQQDGDQVFCGSCHG